MSTIHSDIVVTVKQIKTDQSTGMDKTTILFLFDQSIINSVWCGHKPFFLNYYRLISYLKLHKLSTLSMSSICLIPE